VAEIYLGVGSNVDAERRLALAREWLAATFAELACSRAYRNPAVGLVGGDFVNFVLHCRTDLAPQAVREAVRALEDSAARDRSTRSGAAWTLDIDLLLYGNLVDPLLKLPREDVLRHAYVLCPLAEIAPELRHPVTGHRIGDAWRAHAGAGCAWTTCGWVLPPIRDVADPIVRGESISREEALRA
jgi:2-amino-4-hydroxy-6-hydroxymethyldihydropteridine diphosphokinase